jgi:heterodisulfide reductase subunit A
MIDENISQARAAASRAATVLSKTQLDLSAQVSQVDQHHCISCMTCVTVCPYSAPFCNKDGKGQIEAAKCMGCGICAAECPARAIQLHHFETDQFTVMIKELFNEMVTEGNEGNKEPQRNPACSPASVGTSSRPFSHAQP